MDNQDFVEKSLQRWDAFSLNYINYMQRNTSVFAFTLLNMLRIQQSKRILDAGCAGGYLHQYIINRKQKDCELYAIDFSPKMVEIAAQRMTKYQQNAPNLINFDHVTQEELQNVQIDNPAFKEFNYNLGVASVENLSTFQNDFFDTYFSNLVYHLIQNPILAFQEAYRVLKQGGNNYNILGLFGMTVLSKKEKCKLSTLQQEVFLEIGLLKPEQAFAGFIEDKQIIIEQAKQVGFKNILCWTQNAPFDCFTVDQLLQNGMKAIYDLYLAQDQETQQKISSLLQKKFDDQFNIVGEPFGVECIFLIGEK
ncbi:hypothetical protein pb186bvf_006304 [Paramecium bursaria]